MKPLRLHASARDETNETTRWYAARSTNAGQRFRDEILTSLRKAASSPLLFPAYLHDTRRIFLRRFPYFIVFLDQPEEIIVLAVAHAKRRPGFWQKRTP